MLLNTQARQRKADDEEGMEKEDDEEKKQMAGVKEQMCVSVLLVLSLLPCNYVPQTPGNPPKNET